MSWNYRVIKTKSPQGDDLFSVHEVYYDVDKKPYSWTAEPIDLGNFDSLKNLGESLACMIVDTKRFPPLEIKKGKLVEMGLSERREEGKNG